MTTEPSPYPNRGAPGEHVARQAMIQRRRRVLRSVPEEWVLPILHQRYDDVSGDGLEL